MSSVRILALIIACAFATQTTGMLELFEAPSCCDDGGCPDDNDEGVCPPSCTTCVGKVSPARIAAPLVMPIEIVAAARPGVVVARGPDGIRDGVFHPPRA